MGLLYLCKEILAVCSEIFRDEENTEGRRQNICAVGPGGTYSDHWALNG